MQGVYTRIDLRNFGGHNDEVNCVAFSPDYELMVTGADDCRVRIFNALSGTFLIKLNGHSGPVRCVSVCGNSQFIASGSFDCTVRVWRTSDAQCVHLLEGHTKSVESVAFSSDYASLCSSSWDRQAIIWNITTGEQEHILQGHTNMVQSVAFSPKGHYLATGSWDYTVRLWILEKLPKLEICIDEKQKDEGDVGSPPGTTVYHVDDEDEEDFVMVLKGHKGNVHSVCFSNEGMLASGSWDRTIRLWNPRNGRLLHVLRGHCSWIQAVAFSPDSLLLASACEDDTVKVWDVVLGKCSRTLQQGQMDTVSQCGFAPGGAIIASGSASVALTLL